ncbi:DUF1295 domain-containing protein [Arenicella sp. 4NH20-0111]|uniref:DUF1295 domain-containing protein n=1 Tax=Arenicella sp. 4NH20-0111 TaxID=3127648 RepID=UPI0031064DE8
MERSPVKSLIALFIIIAIGLSVGWAGSDFGVMYQGYPVFFLCAMLAFAINWVVFVPSNMAKSEKFYDLTGSVTYLSIIVLALMLSPELDLRSKLAAAMVAVWAIRLGTFLFIRISQDGHDDRFDEIKINPLRFFTAWTIQGLWALLTAACALVIITNANKMEIGGLGKVGICVWFIGFVLEVVADRQKRNFRKDPENKGRFINVGLWSWSRHPNYFGEIVVWVGMAILAFPVLQGWQYVCLISPVFVTILLTKVSGIPLLQQKGQLKWGNEPEYQAYIASTSLLIPMPPKKANG